VRKQFQTQVPRWIRGLPTVRTDWNALIQTLEGHNKQYYALCFSSDSKSLASAAFDGTIRICDAATGVERQIFQLDGDSVVTMAFSPDNSILALATRYRTIRLWDASTGVEKNSLEGHEDSVKVITFSSSGQLLASGSKDKTVKLWNVNSGTILYTLEGHEGEIITINFLRSATLLGTTSKDKSEIKIWDISTGLLQETRGPYDEYGDPLAVSASGKFLANKALSSIVRLWDTETGEEVQRWQDHEMITCAAFSPDEGTLVNGSFETIKMWDIESGELEQSYLGHKGWLSELLFSPDAKMLASASNDQNIKLWDLTLEPQLDAKTVGHSGWINCIVFSPDDKLIASASHDHTLQLWSATTSLSKQMLGSHETWISDVLFSPDSRLLASAGDKTVKIWNVYNYRELFKLEKHQDWMTNIIFSHDSKLLASVSIDKSVCVWSVTNGALVITTSGDNIRLESPLSHSLTTGDSTHVTFSNQSNFDINCFWTDTQGISKHYWTLRPNEETYQQTYVGHFWRFVNASTSQTIGAYTGIPEHVYVDITNEDVALVEGNKQYLSEVIKRSGVWPCTRTSDEESKSALRVHDSWITLPSGKRLIWLPDEYRPTYYKMKNDTLVLGHASGQVTFLDIKVAAIGSSLHEYFPFLVKRERMDFSNIPNLSHEVD
jgi:WD40 repeat protein